MCSINESDFAKANKVEHLVEIQWHYPILIKYGYEPETKIGIGFVRSYTYSNKKTNRKIICTTGAHADHWSDPDNKSGGYWASLEPYVKELI